MPKRHFIAQNSIKDLHSFKAEKINHSCLGSTERMPMECTEFKDSMDSYFENTLDQPNS